MIIPKGKQLRIRQSKQSVVGDIPLVIEEDITISLTSTFSTLFGGGNTTLLNQLGQVSRDLYGEKLGFSGKFKQLGFQAWSGTDPIAFTVGLGFFMGSTDANDAQIEVYDPMIALAKLTLPSEGLAGSLVAPGPSILSALGTGEKIGIKRKNDSISTRIISLEIGRVLRLESIVVTKAEPTFSAEQDENGYPISGKIQLDINSVFTATEEMLSNRNFESGPTNIGNIALGG